MEVSNFGSDGHATVKTMVVKAVVAETLLAAQRPLVWLLLLTGSLLKDVDDLPVSFLADKEFPMDELHKKKSPEPENKDGSDTDNDDEDEEEDDDRDDDDAGDEDFSGNEGGEDDEEGDPEDSPEANGNGGSDDEEEDDDDGDDDEDEDDDKDEEDEDEDDQPPAKKRNTGGTPCGISLSNSVYSEVAPCLALPALPVFCGAACSIRSFGCSMSC